MPVPNRPLNPWLAAALSAFSCQAGAMVLGNGSTAATMGQPLDFSMQVRGDNGAPLALECVLAEVTMGERKLAPAAVRTLVEPTGVDSARVRVQTRLAVDEPVVQLQLSVGCVSRVSRRYTLLAEPPGYVPAGPVAAAGVPEVTAAAAAAASPPRAESAAPAASPATLPAVADPAANTNGAPRATPSSADAPAPRRSVEAPRAARAPRDTRQAAAASGESPPRRRAPRPAVNQARAPAQPQVQAPAKAASAPATQVAAAPAPAPAAAPVAGPRLRLESTEPAPQAPVAADAQSVVAALVAAGHAASAAETAAAAASAAAARLAVLEQTVEKLRLDAASSRDVASQLRDRLASSEESSRWVMPLIALALGLAGVAGWLAMRLGAAQKRKQEDWQAASKPTAAAQAANSAAASKPSAPTPFVTADSTIDSVGPSTMQSRPAGEPSMPAPLSVDPWSSPETADTQPLRPVDEPPVTAASQRRVHFKPIEQPDNGVPRDVSIEELIDLEQQAEFFVVLGQDEAAVDLLVDHLRSTGGGSPLPYLKLLEIYRRRGEREAYERTRARFNHRFNAYAPEWGSDLLSGATLEDYQGIIPRLQQVWSRPLDAMAELEALLFRKSRGELFELPAYREVLFLYSIARDLLDREAADTGSVDFLLPMSDGSEFGTTAPQPYFAAGPDGVPVLDPDDRPTEPLDLDVSSGAAERRTSIFGDLDEPPRGPTGPTSSTGRRPH